MIAFPTVTLIMQGGGIIYKLSFKGQKTRDYNSFMSGRHSALLRLQFTDFFFFFNLLNIPFLNFGNLEV